VISILYGSDANLQLNNRSKYAILHTMNHVKWLWIVGFALFVLFTIITAITPLAYESRGQWFTPPCDFSLRMTEISCLRQGANPFDVWHGDIVMPPYLPNYQSKVSGPEFTEQINAYAPWEYTMMMPFSFLPRNVAWTLYFTIMLCCLGVIAFAGARENPLLAFLPLLGVAYPTWSNICIGNFSVIVLAAIVGMAVALEKKHDVLAGLCWAIAMLKPQLGIIFAIPLLMRRRWVTCAVAATTCLLLSIIPSIMCHTSVLTLIAQTPAANAFCFNGCGTWPYALCGMFGQQIEIYVALAIGAALCAACTLMLPKDTKWILYLMPAAVCATSWTYASTYGHVMGWFLFVALIIALIEKPRSKWLWLLSGLSLLSTVRWIAAYHGCVSAFSGRFPQLVFPQTLYWHLDSLNSSVDLIIMVLLCVWYSKQGEK